MATPNFDFWDRQSKFSSLYAAALCCDLEPENWRVRENPVPVPVQVMQKRIQEEVTLRVTKALRKKLVFRDMSTYPRGFMDRGPQPGMEEIETDPHYHREDLRAWAEEKGLHPAFLFPEDRNEPKEDRIRADTKESLLVMIALLSRALVEKTGPVAGTPEDPTQAFLVKRIQQEAKSCKFQGSGLSPSNLQARLKEAFEVLRDLSKVRS